MNEKSKLLIQLTEHFRSVREAGIGNAPNWVATKLLVDALREVAGFRDMEFIAKIVGQMDISVEQSTVDHSLPELKALCTEYAEVMFGIYTTASYKYGVLFAQTFLLEAASQMNLKV